MFFFKILLVFLFSQSATMILEVDDQSDDINHGLEVQHIACAASDFEDCDLYEFSDEDLSKQKLEPFLERLKTYSIFNFSFGFQRPKLKSGPVLMEVERDYYEDLENYQRRLSFVKKLMNSKPQSLFVIAAGNGVNLMGLQTKGVPLIKSNAVYPAFLEGRNLIKVAALEDNRENYTLALEEVQLTDYSNYGIEKVELAAKVGGGRKGESLKGTSFAAPTVTKMLIEARKSSPDLSVVELKEMLIKSSYVKNLDQALEWTREWFRNKKESRIYKIEQTRNRKKRDQLIKESGLLFVKSGGPLVEEVFYRSLQIYTQALELISVEESCLQAHQEILNLSKADEAKLKEFWELRGVRKSGLDYSDLK